MSNADRFAQRQDVVMCYKLFLRREPESDEIIQLHLSNAPTIWQLVQQFAESREHEAIKIEEASSLIWRYQDGRNVEVQASHVEQDDILAHVEETWSRYGVDDPYYSVITNPMYQSNNITTELTEEFYRSGVDGVENLKLALERNRIRMDPLWHILELGCGVGRIGAHFCRAFQYYYGVDISSNHLKLAKVRFETEYIRNSCFLLLSEAINQDIKFDIFYSMIALQHNPPPIIDRLLNVFLKKLHPGGYAFFQLPCHLYGYSFDTHRYISGEGKQNTMEMHAFPQRYVFAALHRNGLQPIETWPFPVIGPIGISYWFLARKT